MVEADEPLAYEDMKTFLEEPAILDKFKAAALIANGKLPRPSKTPMWSRAPSSELK